jgi:hypothetical protein
MTALAFLAKGSRILPYHLDCSKECLNVQYASFTNYFLQAFLRQEVKISLKQFEPNIKKFFG